MTSGERPLGSRPAEGSRWRPTAAVLSLSGIKQMCIRLLAAEDGCAVVPGLVISRDGKTWSKPHPCIEVTGPRARPRCTYFVPAVRDLELIRGEASVQVRVGLFTKVETDTRIGTAIFTLSDDGTISVPNWAGDHGHLDCAELAADIAQHQEMVAQLDALCRLGSDEFDYCFMRDVATRDLADAEQAYRDKGCGSPSV